MDRRSVASRRLADRLIGLGANDAKGCVTAMIEASLAAARHGRQGGNLGGTIVLALTAQEETAGEGLAEILDRLRPLDAAVVGEPTGLTPMTAQRGLLILEATARGRTAHPGNTPPQAAENAIVAAAEDVLRLREFDWGKSHPRLGPPHGNVTMIRGGIAHNVIPDACEFCIDVRTTPLESHPALYAAAEGLPAAANWPSAASGWFPSRRPKIRPSSKRPARRRASSRKAAAR